MSEAAVTEKIIKALRAEGCVVVKFHADEYTRAGVPDLLGCCPDGVGLFIEVKDPDGSHPVSKLQQWWLKKFAALGARVGVARSVDEALAIARGEGSGEFV